MAVYFYGCVSLDGYLADAQHGIDWLEQVGSVEETTYEEFYQQMTVTVMGKRTFEEIERLPNANDFYPTTKNYVFTHSETLPLSNHHPVADDVVHFLETLSPDENVFVLGGNTVLTPLLQANRLDYIYLQIAPVVLGSGIPLFLSTDVKQFYELEQVNQYGQFAELVLRKKLS